MSWNIINLGINYVFQKAVKKSRGACGADGVTSDEIHFLPERGLKLLHDIFDRWVLLGAFPSVMHHALGSGSGAGGASKN